MPKRPPKRVTCYSVTLIAAGPVRVVVVVGDPNLVTLTLSSGFRFQGSLKLVLVLAS
jgi:hypothetical protein